MHRLLTSSKEAKQLITDSLVMNGMVTKELKVESKVIAIAKLRYNIASIFQFQ